MKGLWHLDRQEFLDAVQYLTNPTLIPTFPDEILEILVRHASPQNDLTLPLSYYHTVLPSLSTQSSVEHLHSALCRTSVTEAFYFSRSQPEPTRLHMFEMLISLVLHNSPVDTIADRSVELVNLPFTEEEERWFEEYLLNGEGRGLKKARDTVMIRRIGTGRFEESLALRKGVSGRAVNGLDWSSLVGAVQDGLGPRVEV
ncbi:nuclear pore complex assembly-domain-containing protein [Tricladium varicosporioides]|nr:nuclear pore complex assembly-domain-containing protein [Hymenoscyphus varicosporioides]